MKPGGPRCFRVVVVVWPGFIVGIEVLHHMLESFLS